MAATGREVISAVADKLGTTDELLLVHLSSAGGKNEDGFRYKEATLTQHNFMSTVLGIYAFCKKQEIKCAKSKCHLFVWLLSGGYFWTV